MTQLAVRVLGPLEVAIDGAPVATSGPRQRVLVATLALHANRVVSVGALIHAVWGDRAPGRVEHTLQQHVSALRKLLGRSSVTTQSPGYLMHVAELDADLFEASARLGFEAAAAARWRDAAGAFEVALGYWRGPALAGVADLPVLAAAATRFDEQRLAVEEMRLEALLECDDVRIVIPVLEQKVAEHPLRERLHGLLMRALAGAGRQADALNAYQAARRTLVDELGIEPSKELRDLERAILEQRPTLSPSTSAQVAELYATFRADEPRSSGSLELSDGQTILLPAGRALVGRDPSAFVRLVDNRVSRRHAEFDTAAEACALRDLGSTNGTMVNGIRITEKILQDGDVIQIGEGVELRYRAAH